MRSIRTIEWQALIPVRGGTASKTRLAGPRLQPKTRMRLARAFASDVVVAALATPGVAAVTVVTRHAETAQHFTRLGATIFTEDEGVGLNGAVSAAGDHLRRTHPACGVAALMGDLPGITSEALLEALAQAVGLELGALSDHEGTGTTMLTASPGTSLRPAYGSGSYARHIAAGCMPIAVSADSPLRQDVDTLEDLVAATRTGLGPHTRELLTGIDTRS